MKDTKRHPVNMTIPKYLLEYIDQVAEDNIMSRSAAVTQIINQHYKEAQKKGEVQ